MRVWIRIAIVLGVLVAVPFWWLLIEARTDGIPARTIDLAGLRRAAQEVPGPKPVSIEYAPVAVRRMVGAVLVAGGGLKPDLVAAIAFRLVTPGGDTLVDSGMTRAQAHALGYAEWNARAQARVDGWMRSARLIVLTHEHAEHSGGYRAMPAFREIAAKGVFRTEMVPELRALAPATARFLPRPLIFGDMAAIAPGVVLLHTPGHTAGAQMVYVQLQNGREYLFTGDTASMWRNVGWLRPRSRLATDWAAPEDRAATIGWIKGLAALHKREPGLTLVYAHDLAWLQSPRIGPRFATGFVYKTTFEDQVPGDNAPAPVAQPGH